MSFARESLRVFAGVIVWALHFTAIYAFTSLACTRGMPDAVAWGIGGATLAAVAACGWILRAALRRTPAFDAWLTAGIAAMALLAIVWEALPVLMVTPCA